MARVTTCRTFRALVLAASLCLLVSCATIPHEAAQGAYSKERETKGVVILSLALDKVGRAADAEAVKVDATALRLKNPGEKAKFVAVHYPTSCAG